MTRSTTPLTVLMTTDTIGGVWNYAIELCGALNAFDIRVVLATMGLPLSRQQRAAAASLRNIIIKESEYRLEWMDDPWKDIEKAGEWLLSLEAWYRPDIIHLNNYAHGDLPWNAPVMVVGHSCVYSWFEAVKRSSPPDAWSAYHRRVTSGLGAADRIVAPSRAMMSALCRHYGPFRRFRLQVIHNGGALWAAGPKAIHEPLIVSAGRIWDEAKNMALLDRIAPKLDWPIAVAGDCRHPNGNILPLYHIRGLGKIPHKELMSLFAQASIYVSTALYEPFGLSSLEAGLCGCALVLPDIPGSREIWGNNALFASPRDDDEYVAILRRLIAEPVLLNRTAHAARAWALRYPVSLTALRYHGLYCRMLRERGHTLGKDAAGDTVHNMIRSTA
ncbi:MAG: glycosyltransferase [Chitinivibrionales bacterium]|nr:glycosyltransferase [Chitinivibrionales bacterium]